MFVSCSFKYTSKLFYWASQYPCARAYACACARAGTYACMYVCTYVKMHVSLSVYLSVCNRVQYIYTAILIRCFMRVHALRDIEVSLLSLRFVQTDAPPHKKTHVWAPVSA